MTIDTKRLRELWAKPDDEWRPRDTIDVFNAVPELLDLAERAQAAEERLEAVTKMVRERAKIYANDGVAREALLILAIDIEKGG